ncbi:type I-E CRISPR-associated protein Cas5/CasD [Kitasatospora purpeofusca]|uniref:type I-E CRISPR-associated protein Cas5/CasD n=1 Tax=Kitasatospora purpeofusca TaxID=67352 RepID=UPI002E145CB6|nr:type I-E CRISPR-associated protein Cas5/CasD [Kitasatospora purpeofusca]WSR43703.1 type I-E CRISPR-associated protein Cas5/CasD [Kitasatospora purpeofusca]
MSVLLLRLAGPLQSWGVAARFVRRTTEPAPTKSGVLGMLAGALGRDRGEDLADLAALRFAVRTDQPGTRVRDLQTAHHGDTDKPMPLSERFYLADAVFVAAVEGPDATVDALAAALRAPVHLPYLGRRSCPPSGPVDLGVRSGAGLRSMLKREPWQAAPWYRRRHHAASVALPVQADAEPEEQPRADLLRDLPLSFDPRHRRYALRGVVSFVVNAPTAEADHDPTAHLNPLEPESD